MHGILLLGIPTTGKSTIGKLLGIELAVGHISMGQLIRDHAKRDPSVQHLVAAGRFLRDREAIHLVQRRLEALDGTGFILDGFPRTMEQLRFFQRSPFSDGCLHVLLMMDPSIARQRFQRRMNCAVCHRAAYPRSTKQTVRCPLCGGELLKRDDATSEAFDRRMMAFADHEQPVIAELDQGGKLLRFPVTGTPELDLLRLLEFLEIRRSSA